MAELDHSFTHLVCHWLNRHPVSAVACWWDIASPCPNKSPFTFTSDFRGKSLASKLGKQLLSDKLQACGGTAGPADNPTDCLLWIALCCLHWCFWSSPFLPALPGMDAQSSVTLRQAPSPICAQHILSVMSQCSLSFLWCHRTEYPVCDGTAGSVWPLPVTSLRSLWRLCPAGAGEFLSKRDSGSRQISLAQGCKWGRQQ